MVVPSALKKYPRLHKLSTRMASDTKIADRLFLALAFVALILLSAQSIHRYEAFGSFSDFIYFDRSEEHTSELQSPDHLVCRLLLEKKKKNKKSLAHLPRLARFVSKVINFTAAWGEGDACLGIITLLHAVHYVVELRRICSVMSCGR